MATSIQATMGGRGCLCLSNQGCQAAETTCVLVTKKMSRGSDQLLPSNQGQQSQWDFLALCIGLRYFIYIELYIFFTQRNVCTFPCWQFLMSFERCLLFLHNCYFQINVLLFFHNYLQLLIYILLFFAQFLLLHILYYQYLHRFN